METSFSKEGRGQLPKNVPAKEKKGKLCKVRLKIEIIWYKLKIKKVLHNLRLENMIASVVGKTAQLLFYLHTMATSQQCPLFLVPVDSHTFNLILMSLQWRPPLHNGNGHWNLYQQPLNNSQLINYWQTVNTKLHLLLKKVGKRDPYYTSLVSVSTFCLVFCFIDNYLTVFYWFWLCYIFIHAG